MILGAPARRRRFLDLNLSFAHPVYADNLLEYHKVLEQRNKFLKNYRERKEANWEGQNGFKVQLVQLGTEIIKKRRNFLDRTSPLAEKYYQEISGGKERLKSEYKPSFLFKTQEAVEERYFKAFEELENKEKSWGMTFVGPHRDDINLKINEWDLREFGSQGQARTAMLSLKFSAMDYLAELREQSPILLLDEVFADLDEKRTQYLANFLEKKGQVFIATSKEKELEGIVKAGKSFYIRENQIKSE